MLKTSSIFVFTMVLSCVSVGAELGASIERALRPLGQWRSKTTIYVAETPTKILFQNQGSKDLIPASVTKILTAGAVLKHFPPGTKLKTQIYGEGQNIYLKGGGDPGFVSETMWFLVNQFVRTQIKVIEGDIIVDDSFFDSLRFDPSRQKERVDRAYDAPTSAMSFNWNSINVFIRPGAKAGDIAAVFLDPENDYTTLKSDVRTVGGAGNELVVDRDESKSGDHLIVKGKIGVNSKEIAVFKNITKPDIWSGAQLKSFLKQRGIEVKGQIRAGTTPTSAKLLAEAESKPIEQMVADMNKFSNNYVAEMLTKNLGALNGKPGTIGRGIDVIREYIKELGVDPLEAQIFNPSGLTRNNRLSGRALWRVLWDLHSQLLYEPEFLTSLPIAGVDGTLKRRLKGSPAERWVRAKTGYLDGVVSLAGYAGRKDGTVIPFVLIYNGSADEAIVRNAFDDVMKVLVK
ncbi:MAG: D-alanyl-D-alanine carboxypeptidase/D-alanyl-D-alanine-endopeptidase [Bdellovibrio sp.]|jgi:D-alanyl-D-alanine carboxypeptidase/D-alanyl-D-alanine-endopeptidase (penicillin-binding protein 4)